MSGVVSRRTLLQSIGIGAAVPAIETVTGSKTSQLSFRDQSPPVTWSQTYDPGGLATDSSVNDHIVVSDLQPSSHGVLAVGYGYTADAGHGWITSIDGSGHRQWEHVFDGNVEFRAIESAQSDGDSDRSEPHDAIVCGATNSTVRPEAGARNFDPYCARLDDEGELTVGSHVSNGPLIRWNIR
ncbi:uncharacterized protein Nmag_3308 [Natrialba magadii ATCC 43099]|uniref:Twin-arginine translocation signal domain-containing protein n=1 Tax=Natrialba magadii (strain ATCC 43099 / DSM 3394 / CCM 3739 / CIP 104546 / IAM 13178 / JCM 8861 / NBRC 102185 / NCIMB 2190 / MS3) TaxID=547559 RepID=D3SSL3_NATMM|nr:hypothetical protein [Natrialba magadii]ADD06858.1 uncharacterized protein Nmag_3308 [Natrialba magadii ATCC 43099]ELY28214.1 hypothetical protein C500_13691 [Natrialba magadii ATCC 43099]